MNFYQDNQVIFLTGGTGFIGKTLIEKILRSLPQVKKVSGKTLQTRVNEEIFGSRLFDTLKTQFSDAEEFYDHVVSKVVPVQGDITLENLGLSPDDMWMVQSDTSVIINCAAAVSYFHPLREALNMNCYGPLRIFKLAQGMPCLSALVHVSTSYVNTHLNGLQIDEEIYPYPLGDAEQLFESFEKMSDKDLLTYERDVALQVFPNTYIVSKSLTEQLIKRWSLSMDLPVVIVRPSIVSASLSEPVPGWVEGMGAFNGIMTFCALGAIQEWVGQENIIIDVVPVDIVCNTILMAATQAKQRLSTVPVFQIGTGTHNPVTLNQLLRSFERYWQRAELSANNPRVSNDVRVVLYSAADFELRFKQRFPKELAAIHGGNQSGVQKRLVRAYQVPKMFTLFTSNEWFMDASNAISLDTAAPKELYSGLKNGFNWDEYLHIYNMGVHEFIFKEKVDKTLVVDYSWKSVQRNFQSDGEAPLTPVVLSRL